MLTASADEGVCRKAVVYEAVQSLTMPEGAGGWTKREIEKFRLFCERLSREDRSKAPSERAALLPTCVQQQQDIRERGWHCTSFPLRQLSVLSLPASVCTSSLGVFFLKDWKVLS